MNKVLTFLVSTAVIALGATNNCPQVTSTQFTATVPGPAGGSPDNTLAAANNINGANLGCTSLDLTFNNFNVSATAGNAITNSSTYIYQSPSGTAYNEFTTPTTITFATVRGTTDDTTNNFESTSGTHVNDQITYTADAAPGTALSSLVLAVTNTAIDSNGGTATIQVNLCLGGTGTGAITTLAGCTAVGGVFLNPTFTLVNNTGTQTFNIGGFATTYSHIDITNVIDLTSHGGTGHTTDFITFGEQFDLGVPEPSTFLLLGTALAGLGVLRRRHNRKSAAC